jgi:hypothetical protein
MPNNLFITAIVFGSSEGPSITLQLSAIVRRDAETAVAENVATFISQHPGWSVNLVQSVALPKDFLESSLADVSRDEPGNHGGATVLQLVPSAPKRRGRPRKPPETPPLPRKSLSEAGLEPLPSVLTGEPPEPAA